MRIAIIISLLFFLTSCTDTNDSPNTNAEIDDFVSNLKDKSLDQIKDEVNKNIKSFESFVKFFKGSFSNDIKVIAKKDEKFEPAFKVDTTNIYKSLVQFKDISFEQTFENYQTNIEFGFKDGGFVQKFEPIGQGVTESLIPDKIYYSNGIIHTDSVSNYIVDFNFDRKWGKTLPIDSITVKYKLEYLKSYDSITLSLDKPKVNYAGGKIRLVKAKNNYAYITLSDTIKATTKIQGLNKDGKVLDASGHSYGDFAPEKKEAMVKNLLKYLKIVQKKLNTNTFKTVEDFIAYLTKNLKKSSYFNDNDGLFHKEIYFYGNVKTVKLYFAKETETKQTQFTAINNTKFGELIQMPTDDAVVFIDQQGKELFKIEGYSFEKLNSRFYEDQNFYYHLNLEKKQMDTLLVYNLEAFKNGLIGIQQEQESDNFALFNLENKQISNYKYYNVFEKGELLIATTDNQIYLIDKNGKETLLKGVKRIGGTTEDMTIILDKNRNYGFMNSNGKIVIPMKYYYVEEFSNGLVKVQKTNNDNYGFIDKTGKVVIPFIYESVDEFSNGLAKVRKTANGNYGYIDNTGKVIIPFIYEKAFEFVEGITAVKPVDGTYKLIDKTGKVIVDTKSDGGYSISGSGENRVYDFLSKGKYNAYGNMILEEENEED